MKYSQRNDEIIKQRGQDHLTYKEIANKHGICRERVRQILKKLDSTLLGRATGPIFCSHCHKELLGDDLQRAKLYEYNCKICHKLMIANRRSQKFLLDFREVIEKIDFYREKGICDAEISRKIWPNHMHAPQKLWSITSRRQKSLLRIRKSVAKLKILENRDLNPKG